MKRLLFITLIVLTVFSAPLVVAQRTIDIVALGEELASTDTERLLMRLNTPIPDSLLGDSFSSARPLEASLLGDQRARFDAALEDHTGTMVYTLDYAPTLSGPSPEPDSSGSSSASPTAGQPQAVFSSATLTYLLFTSPVDTSDMDEFGSTIQSAMGSEALAGEVEQITINDVPAVRISSVAIVNAVEFHSQWIAVPVGNVVVVAMVIEGSEAFDEELFRSDNESLVHSGIVYLDAILNG